ncbi:hypothetical protein WDZ92_30465 [Nostoc sp. NIES-2111]
MTVHQGRTPTQNLASNLFGGSRRETPSVRRALSWRWPTYERIADRYWAAEDELDEQVARAAMRLMRRYGPDAFDGPDN